MIGIFILLLKDRVVCLTPSVCANYRTMKTTMYLNATPLVRHSHNYHISITAESIEFWVGLFSSCGLIYIIKLSLLLFYMSYRKYFNAKSTIIIFYVLCRHITFSTVKISTRDADHDFLPHRRMFCSICCGCLVQSVGIIQLYVSLTVWLTLQI